MFDIQIGTGKCHETRHQIIFFYLDPLVHSPMLHLWFLFFYANFNSNIGDAMAVQCFGIDG